MILIVGCAVVLALLAIVVLLGRRGGSMPPELEQDWWPEFEREFRAYAERKARGALDRGRPMRDPKPQPQ